MRRFCALFLLFPLAVPAIAQEQSDAAALFKKGDYAQCIEMANKALEASRWGSGWWLLKLRAELATGQYEQALKTYEAAVDRYDENIAIRLLGYDALRANGRPEDAQAVLAEVRDMVERTPRRFEDPPSRIAVGRVLLRSGGDARQILELFYDKAKKESPDSAEPYIAIGELALEKQDFGLAADAYRDAAKRSPDDPDIHLGLAKAFENDSDRAGAALEKALELNPHHVESLLFQADNLIDREAYEQAEEILKKALEVNPKDPRAWAYRAVMAHLAGDRAAERAHRDQALELWKTNPGVDHLIGLKLSQKYRFAEGSGFQRKALELVSNYRPAKIQLCEDLLRLGKEEEGWRLADEVFKEDQYNILAYNLLTLHDSLSKFKNLENPHFLVRMDPREAQIYGDRAVRLLERAREKLCSKYGVELAGPTTVEIFPQQKDFAIRTFGLPGGAGFLGVCFGSVVTVNSPASRASHPSNWEAILWHEFCHTVTLHKTHNKMPRWLSEGISVYEERQEQPNWGQQMTPQYRELILEDGATPVSKLSGAFLKPPTPMHLQFAYYESSMVVEYVIQRFGAGAMRQVLDDLGQDVPINEALAKRTEPIEKLDEAFAAWFKTKAEQLAPGTDWERPKLELDAGSAAMAAWNQKHPNNFWGLLGEGRALIAERKWKEAKVPLEKAIALYPTHGETGGPYVLLAAAHRELAEKPQERAMLEKHVALNADAIEPRLRLIDIAISEKDWPAAVAKTQEIIAINPLIPAPHRYLAQAAEALKQSKPAIEAHRTLLLLDPLDRSEHHYRLARLLADEKQLPAARREVVMALEEAPRYRDAHKLLLEIAGKMDRATTVPSTRPGPTPKPTESNP